MKDQLRASKKAMGANKRAAADSSSDYNSRANKKCKKGRDNKSKLTRTTTAQGTTRYCELCKRAAGMPYGKYSSHSTSQCKDAAEMKAKLSGGYKDHAEANNAYKKEHNKAMLKEVKVLRKQNKQLMKIMAKASKPSKKEQKNLHKLVSRTKTISLSRSDSGSSSNSSSNSDSD